MRFCTLCRRATPEGASICSFDGSPLTGDVVVEPASGTTVGTYRLNDVVAHGGTGVVFRAENTSHNIVALKILKAELSGNASVMHRIRRETKNAIKLAGPNVARVNDCGDHDAGFFIAREWLEGQPLSVAIREEGPMDLERAARIAHQICAGLALVHRVGLVHRDLKPNHVILVETDPGQWTAKLIDIGMADKVPVQSAREILGTPQYLSPEQAEGKLISFRSDLYSLGCLIFELLTGQGPFSGDIHALVQAHKSQAPPDLQSVRADVPEAFSKLVAKLLAKQASARPFSAAMVQREIEKIVPSAKEPLGPAVPGRTPPVIAAPQAQTAPSQADQELGMAQTLFGGNALTASDVASAAGQAAPAPVPQPDPVATAPTAPERPAPAAVPQAFAAPQAATQSPATPFRQPAKGDHKRTMLGMPVFNPDQLANQKPQEETPQAAALVPSPAPTASPAPAQQAAGGTDGYAETAFAAPTPAQPEPSQVEVQPTVQPVVDKQPGAAAEQDDALAATALPNEGAAAAPQGQPTGLEAQPAPIQEPTPGGPGAAGVIVDQAMAGPAEQPMAQPPMEAQQPMAQPPMEPQQPMGGQPMAGPQGGPAQPMAGPQGGPAQPMAGPQGGPAQPMAGPAGTAGIQTPKKGGGSKIIFIVLGIILFFAVLSIIAVAASCLLCTPVSFAEVGELPSITATPDQPQVGAADLRTWLL